MSIEEDGTNVEMFYNLNKITLHKTCSIVIQYQIEHQMTNDDCLLSKRITYLIRESLAHKSSVVAILTLLKVKICGRKKKENQNQNKNNRFKPN